MKWIFMGGYDLHKFIHGTQGHEEVNLDSLLDRVRLRKAFVGNIKKFKLERQSELLI